MSRHAESFYFLLNRGYTDMTEYTRMLLICKYSANHEDLKTLYKMIGHCRDKVRGKGERDLSYRMVLSMFSVFPELASKALRHLILDYGGWNDVKYFCLFVEKEGADCEPLVSFAISLANKALRESCDSNVSKWIPREKGHKDLYDRFVRDWFGSTLVTNGMRQEYRYLVSGASLSRSSTQRTVFRSLGGTSCVIPKNSGFLQVGNTMAIGEYVRGALVAKGAEIDWVNMRWDVLVASSSDCGYSIPVVDIDIAISKEGLFHALGFACLLAQKSGAWRVLLVSGEPLWIDLSPSAGNFCSMVSILWEHCEIRTRSQFSLAFDLLYRAPSCGIRFFVFSETFAFDWDLWIDRLGSVVLWNIGIVATLPVDFYPDDHKNLSLMSGFMPSLISCSNDAFSGFRYDPMDSSFGSVATGSATGSVASTVPTAAAAAAAAATSSSRDF
jgi:hypothetical protein